MPRKATFYIRRQNGNLAKRNIVIDCKNYKIDVFALQEKPLQLNKLVEKGITSSYFNTTKYIMVKDFPLDLSTNTMQKNRIY